MGQLYGVSALLAVWGKPDVKRRWTALGWQELADLFPEAEVKGGRYSEHMLSMTWEGQAK